MQLVSLTQQTQAVKTGRLSDGSDEQTVQVQNWQAVVLDDNGMSHTIDFAGTQPTNQQILDRIPRPSKIVPTSKTDLADYMASLYEVWARWKATRVEAQARTLAAPVVNALTNQENAAWTAYANAVQAWVAAS